MIIETHNKADLERLRQHPELANQGLTQKFPLRDRQ